jgi:multidrug efflux pump subunit AcrA (membrane-fusion protein)
MSMPAEPQQPAPPAPRVEPPAAPQTVPAPPPAQPVDITALIKQAADEAAARTRAELQSQLDAANSQLTEIKTAEQQRLDAEQAAADEAARIAKEAEEADMSAKDLILKRDAEWQERLAQMERSNRQELARMDLERQLAELKAYTRGKIAEAAAKKSIHPSFYDYITGTSEAEIDAAIELAEQKTSELFEEFQAGGVQRRSQMPGVSTASGPSSMGSVPELATDIDYENMDMATFVKNRPNLPPGRVVRDQGMFS